MWFWRYSSGQTVTGSSHTMLTGLYQKVCWAVCGVHEPNSSQEELKIQTSWKMDDKTREEKNAYIFFFCFTKRLCLTNLELTVKNWIFKKFNVLRCIEVKWRLFCIIIYFYKFQYKKSNKILNKFLYFT